MPPDQPAPPVQFPRPWLYTYWPAPVRQNLHLITDGIDEFSQARALELETEQRVRVAAEARIKALARALSRAAQAAKDEAAACRRAAHPSYRPRTRVIVALLATTILGITASATWGLNASPATTHPRQTVTQGLFLHTHLPA